MSDATLKIELVGATEQEQQAFNNPQSVYQSPQVDPPAQSISRPDSVTVPASTAADTQNSQSLNVTFESLDQLLKKIDELISASNGSALRQGQQPESQANNAPQSALGRLGDKLDRVLQKFDAGLGQSQLGRTTAGRIVRSGLRRARSLGGRVARGIGRTKLGRAIGSGLNRMAGRLGAGAAAGTGEAAAASAGMARAVAAVGAVAGPIAGVTIAAAAAGTGLLALSEIAHRAGQALEDLSPELALTKAQFEANRELARLDRAQRIGAGTAQIEAARNRISESMYEVQTKILEIIVKFAPLIEGMLDAANTGVRGIDLVVAALNVVASRVDDLSGNFGNNAAADAAFQKSFTEFENAMKSIFDNNPQGNPGMDPFLADVLRMQGPRGARRAPMPPNPGQLP